MRPQLHGRAARRDVKSSNILLTAEGVAKIADVGLARVGATADQQSWDNVTGTFAYAAPELIIGTRCTDKVRTHLGYSVCMGLVQPYIQFAVLFVVLRLQIHQTADEMVRTYGII